MPTHPLLGYALGFVGVIIFGSTLPVTRLALEDFSAPMITFGRAALATCLAAIILIILKRKLPKAHVKELIFAGIMVIAGFPLCLAYGLTTVDASHGGVVLGILPLLTATFAALYAGEKLPLKFWIWAVLGACLVVAFSLRDSGLDVEAGDIWLLIAAISAALGYVCLGRVSRHMPGWESICWALVLTTPISIGGAVLASQSQPLPSFIPNIASPWMLILYLGLFSQFLGFFAWNAGMKLGGIAKVGQVQLLQTFITLGIAAWLNKEQLDSQTLLFALAIMFCVAFGSRSRQTKSNK